MSNGIRLASLDDIPEGEGIAIDKSVTGTADNIALLRDDEGYEVYATRSGEEALRVAPAAMPGLILMDLTLPQGDPEDIAHRLRSRPGWRDVALVICSGAERLREEAERLGAIGYLAKPFGLADVIDLVERLGVPRRPRGDG